MLVRVTKIYEGFEVEITKKRMKNLSLRITEEGKIKLSTPKIASQKIIDDFVLSKIDWIKKNLKNKNLNENLYLGKPITISKIHSFRKTPSIEIQNDSNLTIKINTNLSDKTINKHIEKWYEERLNEISKPFFEKWEKILDVKKSKLRFRKMSGKWGYCECKNKIICLNILLIKKDLRFIEYVILHELCHLIVPNHSKDFKNLLDIHMPSWREIR